MKTLHKVQLDDQAFRTLREMARESSCTMEELATVAIYNLVALYLREKRPSAVLDPVPPVRHTDGLDSQPL